MVQNDILTFDSRLNLKIFTPIMTEPTAKLTSKIKSTVSCYSENSLIDILSETPWQGQRIYRMRLSRKRSHSSSRN